MASIQAGPRHAVKPVTFLAAGVAAVMVLRLAALGWPALCDKTESRYALISWEMARSGDWVTPRIVQDGELRPFWGKPPLLFWLTAGSFRLLGASEFSARLPGWLAGAVMFTAAALFAHRFWGGASAAFAAMALVSSVLFVALAGSVTTDATLGAAHAASFVSFAMCAAARSRRGRLGWGLLFFLALAAGALAKGPIAVALAGLSLLAWAALSGKWRAFRLLPWGSGLLLFAAAAVPWYVAAERATPGFLRYFFVNEHFLRYLSRDYGDLYGAGHPYPPGTIWGFLAAGFLPWTVFAAVPAAAALVREGLIARARREPWLAYALAWALAPAVFFTAARQILLTYALPALPGLAVFTGVMLARRARRGTAGWMFKAAKWSAAVLAGGGLAGALAGALTGPPVPLFLALAVACAVVLWGVFHERDLPSMAAFSGVAVILLATAGVLALREEIRDRYSAAAITARVMLDSRYGNRPVEFVFGTPASAELYHRLRTGVRPVSGAGRSDAVVVMKRKDWERLVPDERARFRQAVVTRNWVALLRSSP